MTVIYGINLILLNGIVFVVGICCLLMGLIMFILTARAAAQKKLTGTITEIKSNLVSRVAVLRVTDAEGTRDLEAGLQSKSKVGDSIRILPDKRTGQYFEYNPKRLITVALAFIGVGLLIVLPALWMTT